MESLIKNKRDEIERETRDREKTVETRRHGRPVRAERLARRSMGDTLETRGRDWRDGAWVTPERHGGETGETEHG